MPAARRGVCARGTGRAVHCQRSCETEGMPGTARAVGTECRCHLVCSCQPASGRHSSSAARAPTALSCSFLSCSCPKAALTLPAGCWVLLSWWISATSTIRKEMLLGALQLQPAPSEHLPGVHLPPQTALSEGCFSRPCFPSLPSTHSSHGPTSASQCPGQSQGKGAELLRKKPAHQAKLAPD